MAVKTGMEYFMSIPVIEVLDIIDEVREIGR